VAGLHGWVRVETMKMTCECQESDKRMDEEK